MLTGATVGESKLDLLPTANVAEATTALQEALSPVPDTKDHDRAGELALQRTLQLIVNATRNSKPEPLPVVVFLYADYSGMPKAEADHFIDELLEASAIAFGIRNRRSEHILWLIGEQKEVAHYIAAETGGQYFEATPETYATALDPILRQLHGRYELGFKPQHLDGKRHKLRVELANEARNQHRGGAPAIPCSVCAGARGQQATINQNRWTMPLIEFSVMEHKLSDTMALLSRTPAALNALLRDLPDSWTLRNEGENNFNAFDVVGHLIHGERTDWMSRARMILEYGETRGFEPFDRFAQVRESQGKSLPQLLDEFARLRSENLDQLRALNLQPQDLERRGRHPSLGVVTLSQLLATWAAHDLTHLHQLSRIMAHQYRDIVGPWAAFLGVMKCAGHSS